MRSMTRRAFFPFLILGVGLGGAAYTALRYARDVQQPLRTLLHPRYRRRRKHGDSSMVSLAEGFYRHKRSAIVHYVDAKGLVRHVAKLNPEKLQESTLPQLAGADLQSGFPRLDLSTSGFVLEAAARGRLDAGDRRGGLALLDNAIRHDIVRLRRAANRKLTRQPARRARLEVKPDFRIYDLMAAEAVRGGLRESIGRMIALIATLPPEPKHYFETRLKKWTDQSSAWYKKHRVGSTTAKPDLPM
jgi:hypothetical protein